MSFLIWAGAALALIGALRLLLTLRIFGRRPRGRALALALTGIACVALGFTLPGAEARTANSRQLIDTFVPTDHFHESHWERIRATPREIFAAIHAVRPNEVHGFVPLLWARSPGARRPSAALMRRPILELMKGQHFVVLAEQPGREIVVGTIGQYWANRTVPLRTAAQFRSFKDPRYAKVAMNVRVRDEGNGWCKVTTETRVLCVDMHSRRKFDAYWRVIYPGSALLRGQWLAAIKRRAERPTGMQSPGVGDARFERKKAIDRLHALQCMYQRFQARTFTETTASNASRSRLPGARLSMPTAYPLSFTTSTPVKPASWIWRRYSSLSEAPATQPT